MQSLKIRLLKIVLIFSAWRPRFCQPYLCSGNKQLPAPSCVLYMDGQFTLVQMHIRHKAIGAVEEFRFTDVFVFHVSSPV